MTPEEEKITRIMELAIKVTLLEDIKLLKELAKS